MSTPIGQLLPDTTQPVTVPYLTPAQFRNYPTWLDTDNLVPGGAASLQTDTLADVLLAASEWASNECGSMRLSAHLVTGEQLEARAGAGRIVLQPRDVPVTSVTALSYGWDPAAMTALALPDPTVRNTAGRLISFRPGGGTSFTGPMLQFGGAPAPTGKVYVTWSYVAGFVTSALASPCSANAATVTVTDPTGIMPGSVLRIYDAGAGGTGASEALTAAASYVPQVPTSPPTATAIPLAANTAFAHAAGTGLTGFPRDALQAVYAYAVVLLMRPDVSARQPRSGFGPGAPSSAPGGSPADGLIANAQSWLNNYQPVLR